MKRLLLPLLAALALPTAVNAEVIYLTCSGTGLYPYFRVTINESANTASLSGTRGTNPAILNSTQNTFTVNQSWFDYWNVFKINRINGYYSLVIHDKQFPSMQLKKWNGSGTCTKEAKIDRAF